MRLEDQFLLAVLTLSFALGHILHFNGLEEDLSFFKLFFLFKDSFFDNLRLNSKTVLDQDFLVNLVNYFSSHRAWVDRTASAETFTSLPAYRAYT